MSTVMTTEVIPTIAIQEIYSGNKFTGVATTFYQYGGYHTGETIARGRIQKWLGCTAGGLFSSPADVGMSITHVWWDLDCTNPTVDIYLVDDDGIEYLIDSQATTASGSYIHPDDGILVPPGFALAVKSSVNIDAVVSVSGEDTGVTGDGTTVSYDLTFDYGRTKEGTFSITAGSVTFTDSAGILTGTGGGGGSGTVDYYAGTATITLNTPSDFNATNALADYDYYKIGRVGITNERNWGQILPASIGKCNLPPGQVRS